MQNYLGFDDGIAGEELLQAGRRQVERYGVRVVEETIVGANRSDRGFKLQGRSESFECRRLLLATGLFHLPPEIPGAREWVGRSLFFCKDCDAYRVRGQRIGVVGCNDEAVEYALAIVAFTSCVAVMTNGKGIGWSQQHGKWLQEYEIPVYVESIRQAEHNQGHIRSLTFGDGRSVQLDCIFTTRGDVYHNALARQLGAATDPHGEITVNSSMATNVPGLYAAGCVTPANCQMIIAAGHGAAAAQAINRDLFEESLRTHSLREVRSHQLHTEQTEPEVID